MEPPIECWGIDAPLEPLRGGHRNLVFRTRGLARDLVFKSTRRSEAAMVWLAAVQGAARDCGMSVPEMRRSLDGRLVEAGWSCEDFVPGETAQPEDLAELQGPIEGFQERMRETPQRPGFLSSVDLLTDEAGGDVDLSAMPPGLVARCREAWGAVAAGPQCVVHGDISPGNAIRSEDGRLVLIDWDECRRDLTLFDRGQLWEPSPEEARAVMAWEIACSWTLEPDHARALAARF